MMMLRGLLCLPRRKEAKVREKQAKDIQQQKKDKQDRIKAGKDAIRSMLDQGLGSMPGGEGGASQEVTIKTWGDQLSVLECFTKGHQGASKKDREAAFFQELASCASEAALPPGAVEEEVRGEVMACFTEDQCRQLVQRWWEDVDKTIASSKGVFSELIKRCLQCERTRLTPCSRLRA